MPVLQEETVDSSPSIVSGGTDAMDVTTEHMAQEYTQQLLTVLQPEVQGITAHVMLFSKYSLSYDKFFRLIPPFTDNH